VLEGQSTVYVCALNAQRQAFLNRELQIKRGEALQVEVNTDDKDDFKIGLAVHRKDHQARNKWSESEASDDDDETIGI